MIKRLLGILAISLVLSGCAIQLPSLPGGKKAGLQVSSFPAATVFLDGNSLGTTPLQKQENLKPGTVTVKIVPQDTSLPPYETKVTLTPGVLTVIDRKFNSVADMSSGYILSFEPISNKKQNQIAVTTLPNAVNVTIDNAPLEFTPTSLDNINEGDHRILLTSPGYEEKLILARSINGYRLVVNAQLAKKPIISLEVTPTATPSAQISLTPTPSLKITPTKIPTPTKTATSSATLLPKPYVEVTSSAGFVNVRATAATTGTLLGKANNGETFPYISTVGDWVQLTYTGNQVGWVNAPYVTVVK